MEQSLGLQSVIYNVLKMQIQFGVYSPGDRLPTMEDICRLFHVSIKTIRAAFLDLQKEGYLKISKKVGVKVTVEYSEAERERHIQDFFSLHRDGLIDLGRSMRPLLSRAQCMGYQNASPETLDELIKLDSRKDILPPHRMIMQLQLIYGSVHNDLLMRLIWQEFMYYQAPFLSVPDNLKRLVPGTQNPMLHLIHLSRQKNWAELQRAVELFQEQFCSALLRFYKERIFDSSKNPQVGLVWSGYKKGTQRCYSLAMELLIGIVRGTYCTGDYLPPTEKLAKEKQVSVSTVRRSLAVMNSIGAMKSVNGVGTKVLPLDQITENCDFTQPVVKKRLADFVQSLQLFMLSCKGASKVTLETIDTDTAGLIQGRLRMLQRLKKYDLAAYEVLELIAHHAPYQAIRTVYSGLFHQLLWGYPLRGMDKGREGLESFYHSYLDFLLDCLERSDADGFACKMEEILTHELNSAVELLEAIGIQGVEGLRVKEQMP